MCVPEQVQKIGLEWPGAMLAQNPSENESCFQTGSGIQVGEPPDELWIGVWWPVSSKTVA